MGLPLGARARRCQPLACLSVLTLMYAAALFIAFSPALWPVGLSLTQSVGVAPVLFLHYRGLTLDHGATRLYLPVLRPATAQPDLHGRNIDRMLIRVRPVVTLQATQLGQLVQGVYFVVQLQPHADRTMTATYFLDF